MNKINIFAAYLKRKCGKYVEKSSGMQECKVQIAKNMKICKKILVFRTEILYNVKGQKRCGKRMELSVRFYQL